MKKEYVIPKIEVHHIGALLMLTTSDGEGDGNQFSRSFDAYDEE